MDSYFISNNFGQDLPAFAKGYVAARRIYFSFVHSLSGLPGHSPAHSGTTTGRN
jgi:hypothetical protein